MASQAAVGDYSGITAMFRGLHRYDATACRYLPSKTILVTKNAILLVDFAHKHKLAGASTQDALLVAGPIRLRPILMTTAAMILGLAPVAIGAGEGGEARAPMATVVIGGLITSTVLTLLVVPVVFSLIEGLRDRVHRSRPPAMPLATIFDSSPQP